MNAKKFNTIVVIDPDTMGQVELTLFKHCNGGIFAIDSSYIEQCLPEDGNVYINDPLNNDGEVELLGV